ncbi:hypothetical protein PWV72_09895, partial [Lactobacillus paragasseri]|uniref:hypothetical protein n=1 Tax=Lactobacillus paragasseri TaxID=2107999 RepID=UPI00237FC3FC
MDKDEEIRGREREGKVGKMKNTEWKKVCEEERDRTRPGKIQAGEEEGKVERQDEGEGGKKRRGKGRRGGERE